MVKIKEIKEEEFIYKDGYQLESYNPEYGPETATQIPVKLLNDFKKVCDELKVYYKNKDKEKVIEKEHMRPQYRDSYSVRFSHI